MKNFKTLILLAFFSMVFSAAAEAYYPTNNNQERHHHRRHGGGGAVGAPLDGGLLAILGAAGITYYVSRKRKKGNIQE